MPDSSSTTDPFCALDDVTRGEVCRVVSVSNPDDANISTIKGRDYSIHASFEIDGDTLRSLWRRLLSCRNYNYKPVRVRPNLIVRLFHHHEEIGAAELNWANNSSLVLIRGYFSSYIYDASAPDAISVRQELDALFPPVSTDNGEPDDALESPD